MEITISKNKNKGDIPTYSFTSKEVRSDYFTFLDEQLNDEKVIVCFFKDKEAELNDFFKGVHNDFFITNCPIEATDYFNNCINKLNLLVDNFFFFGFETYEEAFKYCIDLKEGL